MADIEELAQILGPGDLDWSGDAFCFLEYDDQQLPDDGHHPHELPSGNKRRMSEAFQLNHGHSYPSHTCGPVLVAPPSVTCKGEHGIPSPITEVCTAATSTTASVSAEDDARTEAIAQRMERKKTREKMRRQEVNDKFNELMEALAEVEANPSAQATRAANMDKGNFRVDVLSRAVRVIKKLNEEVKVEHAEVERLRRQLQETGISRENDQSSSNGTSCEERGKINKPMLPHGFPTGMSLPHQGPGGMPTATVPIVGKPGMAPLWVTLPMWMPPSTGNKADGTPNPMMLPPPGTTTTNPSSQQQHQQPPFPFAMPFYMPPSANGPNGATLPQMPMPGFLPPHHHHPSFPSGASVTPPSTVDDAEEEAPTHAPCA